MPIFNPLLTTERRCGIQQVQILLNVWLVYVVSLCGRTYQTETAMSGDTFYSATITLVLPVTLVLHGLLPLHPLGIPVLLHSIYEFT